MRRILGGLWLLCGLGLTSGSWAATPTDSIYQLQIQLTTQSDTAIGLDAFRQHPVLISMFYGSCPHTCPLLISRIKRLESRLPESARQNLRVVLVSFDPERDTASALSALAQRHRVDATRWMLASASAHDVRQLAAVLGIRYRRLPDGEFNHSTIISLLDAEGRILQQTSKLSGEDDTFQAALQQAAAGVVSR